VYQLSSVEPSRSRDPGRLERLLFARYTPRKLSAEVLLDAVSQVTGVAHTFRNYPKGTRAIDVDVPDGPDYFLVTFGLPRRDVLADRSKTPTLSQALHLMNGDSIAQKLRAENNVLAELLSGARTDEAAVSELFERAYARPASPVEMKRALAFIAGETAAGRGRRRAFEGVLWSILNSKEFQLNH
jgi:hypothetical protein